MSVLSSEMVGSRHSPAPWTAKDSAAQYDTAESQVKTPPDGGSSYNPLADSFKSCTASHEQRLRRQAAAISVRPILSKRRSAATGFPVETGRPQTAVTSRLISLAPRSSVRAVATMHPAA